MTRYLVTLSSKSGEVKAFHLRFLELPRAGDYIDTRGFKADWDAKYKGTFEVKRILWSPGLKSLEPHIMADIFP